MKKLLVLLTASIAGALVAADLSPAAMVKTEPIVSQAEPVKVAQPVTPSTKDLFIQKLNKALADEYGAAIQYTQHAAVIKGAQYDCIGSELKKHAKEEMEHATTLSAIIDDFGGTPSTEVEKREISPDAATMLGQDLAGEEAAIVLYKELIKMADELGEPGYSNQIKCILIQEQEHRRDLSTSLGK